MELWSRRCGRVFVVFSPHCFSFLFLSSIVFPPFSFFMMIIHTMFIGPLLIKDFFGFFSSSSSLIFYLMKIDKDMGHPSRRIITKPLDPVVHHQEEEYNNEGIISVYCAILGAIVLGKSLAFSFSSLSQSNASWTEEFHKTWEKS